MTLEISFFNLQMTNLFIGLFSKHPLLRPHSVSIHKLGYSIHSIEPSFTSQGNTVNPEAIVYSPARKHTLLTEWTAANSLSYEKGEQIRRYLLVDANDLINSARVALDACRLCSLWVTVLPTSLQTFKDIIDSTNSDRLLLCSFCRVPTGEYCIEFHSGNIRDTELSLILTENMKFKRIPEGYLPIPIENLRDQRFTDGVIQQVVAFLIRKRYEFSVEDICDAMIGIWAYLSTEKKRGVREAVKRVMRELLQQSYCRDWLTFNYPNWEARNLPKSKLDKFINAVKADGITSNQLGADSISES
ncbi:hypothetical protein L3556_01875 [Candidatus Synechococcus calcipolaris G9]|uniref:Uncharacterized protein n=1 Tax=Candidatus Synechococcus calcipolaris G9 TaxID=1497997 RepID=A0ABT6EV37_9SYNE|nr:hypothetical protein [Candidatus Synechococcus calcipolaris]MDG2989687.1 hypothetical protein [Candidatus Synechococcus calcipolaris G9]